MKKTRFLLSDERDFVVKKRNPVPFEFVLDALAPLAPHTKPFFGCVGVYVGDKIVLILRDKTSAPEDNGVWIATYREHHATLRRLFPTMRSISVLPGSVTDWQVLPSDDPDFEERAMAACQLVLQADPRIGRIPKSRKRSLSVDARRKSPKTRPKA